MRVGKRFLIGRFLLLVAAGGLLWPMQALPLPQNGSVVAGQAEINQAGSQMTITQQSGKAIINWDSYSIDVNELVQYIQPGADAISLNRVVGTDPTAILGQLIANGQVWIINPNGILFGKDATVNVAGLLATTLNISDSDFLNGNYEFNQDTNSALSYIINKGKIIINDNGYAILVAPLVSNEGLIIANLGKVRIAGAEKFTVNFDGSNLVNFAISNSPQGQQPGTVLIPEDQITDIIKEVVNTPAIVEAGQIVEENGITYLVGASGTVINTGTIQANGAPGQDAGSIVINSTQATAMVPGSLLSASGAGENSNGGEIRVLSAGNLAFTPGVIAEAKGGITGNGGLVEASAGGNIYLGATVNTMAEGGEPGIYFIDPTTLIVADGSRPGGDIYTGGTYGGFLDTPATDTIYETELENATSNIVLQATQNITVQNITDDIIDITNPGISISMQTIGSGSISFDDINDTIRTNGGNIDISNPNGSVHLGNLTTQGGTVTILAATGDHIGNISTHSTTGNGGAVGVTITDTSTLQMGLIDASSSNAGSAGGDVTITASNADITTGSIYTTPGAGGTPGNLSIVANTINTGQILTGGGSVTISLSGADNSFGQISTGGGATGGAINITGGVNYTFNSTLNSNGGQILISSNDGLITINDDILSAGGDITITGGESVIMAAGTSINSGAGSITVTADTGNITLYALTTNNNDITISSNGGGISLNGNISTSGGGLVISGGDTIAQATGTTINTGAGDITFSADNDITIADITTTGTAAITSANGSIGEDNDSSVDLTAGVVVLSAGDNTPSGTSNIDIDTSSTDITATADNNITIDNNNAANGTANLTSRITGDIVFNQTGGGNIDVTAQTTGSDITVTNDSGDIIATSVVAGGNGDVVLDTSSGSGDINLGYASGDLVALLSGGAVEEFGTDSNADVVASDLYIDSQSGVGTLATIEIDVTDLAIDDNSANGVDLLDTSGGLNIDSVTYGVNTINGVTTQGGVINITTSSPLYINQPVNSNGGNINLTAQGASDGDIYIYNTLNSAGGNINVTADRHIEHNDSGDITTSGGNYLAIAGNYGATTTGHYTMTSGSVIDTTTAGSSGNVSITADEDVTLAQITTFEATGPTGNILVLSNNGSILDDSDNTTMLNGDQISLTANQNIGVQTNPVDIDLIGGGTNPSNLSFTATNGDVYLTFYNDDLSTSLISSLTVGGSNIGMDVESGFDIIINNGLFDGITQNLTLSADNIELNYDVGNDIDTTGNVSLTATTGYIHDTSGTDANTDIIADDLQMTAQTGIDGAAPPNPNQNIETDVSSLTATNNTSGSIRVDNYSSTLQINGLTNNATGAVTTTIYNTAVAGATMTIAGDVTTYGQLQLFAEDGLTINNGVTINSNNGNIFLISDNSADGVGAFIQNTGSTINAGTGVTHITLSQASTLNDVRGPFVRIYFAGDAEVSDNGSTSVTATNFEIDGQGNNLTANGINLNTSVSNLEIGNFGSSSGDITITNTGALTINDWDSIGWGYAVNNPGGNVNISTASPLTVSDNVYATGDITLTAGGTGDDGLTVGADIQSTGGNVTLQANKDILINSGTISAGGGDITLTADYNSNDTGYITQSGGMVGSGTENLIAIAAEGITLGSISTSMMSVASISATNGTGDVYIYNDGSLTVNGITNNGLIRVRSLSYGGGTNPSLIIAGDVSSNGGIIDIGAEGDVIQNDGTTISSSGGEIGIEADLDVDNDGTGSITQNGSATITSNGGDIYVIIDFLASTGQNISITSIDAGTGFVLIGTTGGAIIDNDTTDDNDITADSLYLYATEGIGSTNPIETAVSYLDIYNETGDVNVANTGDLVLADNSFFFDNYSVYVGGGNVNISTASTITIDDPIETNGGDLTLTATTGIIQNAYIDTGSGDYTANAGSGPYTMNSGSWIDCGLGGGNVSITAGEDATVSSITGFQLSITSTSGSILDDSVDSTYLTASWMTLTAAGNIGGTDGQSGIRPEFLDIDALNLAPAGSLTLVGAGGSDVYLNFVNHDFDSRVFNDSVPPTGISPNNSTTSINSLTIGVSGGNDLEILNNIFNVDDSGNPTGIYYDLNLLSTGNLIISNPIVTNEDLLTLGTAGNLVLSMTNITFNNPGGTLIEWADFDQDGNGAISGGAPGSPVNLNNVDNLILIAGSGITSYTQANGINIAAYNSTSGNIIIDNVGDITVFDGTSYVGVPGIDVNGINNNAGGDVSIYAHSDVNINAPINTFGGDLTITATESIIHNELGDITTSGGTYTGNFDSDGNLTGSYIMADTGSDASVINVGTGNVSIYGGSFPGFGGQGILVSQITGDTSTSTIALLTASGSISETTNETGGYDISGRQLAMVAGTGIDLDNISVSLLSAENSGTGDIDITNTAPTLSGLEITSYSFITGLTNSNGDITILENSPVVVNAPITANGNINITATDTVPGDNTGDITVNAGITGVNVGFVADDLIDINNSVTSSGILTLTADGDIDIGANVHGSTSATLTADNDTDGIGSIIYTSGLLSSPTMTLSGVAIGSVANPLSIDAGTLTAQAGSGNTAGDIYLNELDNITITSATTFNGVINVVAGNDLNAVNISTGNNNDISLTSNNGDITIGTVNAGTGNVEVIATNGNIGNLIGTITGQDVYLSSGGDILVGTSADRLQATGNGAVYIDEADDVELADINSLGYSINNAGAVITKVNAGGSITITDEIQSPNADVEIEGGNNIAQNANITASGQDVTILAGGTFTMGNDIQINTIVGTGSVDISAGGDITLGQLITGDASVESTGGSIIAANNTSPEIQANTADLTASTGIGGANFDTQIGTLTAEVTGTGNIEIHNLGGLIINSAITNNGSINIDTQNDMTITNISASGGDVTLAVLTSGNMNVGTIQTDQNVYLSVNTGGILDNNGALTNIVANGLSADSDNGISLDTVVSQIALNNVEGDIDIFNQGNLDITTVGTISGITNDGTLGPANINLVNVGELTISQPVTVLTNGEINLEAYSPVNVNANVSAPGNISIMAGDNATATNDDISIAANINITSTGGDVTLQAGDDIVQAAGTGVISAGGGDIYLYAGHDNDGTGLINMQGKVGSGAENLVMEADETIIALTNVSTLTATTDNADITITEDNALALNLVDAGSGDVSITVNAGNLTDNNAGANNIAGNDVVLNVVGGDIGTAADSLETDIDTLAIPNAGNAYINEANGIILNNIIVTNTFDLDTQNNGSVTSAGGTTITATSLDINADGAVNINTGVSYITIATSNDNVVVNEGNGLAINTINAGSGDVTLTLAAGAITDNNAGANNITADQLDVTAPGGVDLDTNINTLTADTTGANGNINIEEANGLALNNVNAGTGDVILTLAAGALNSNPGTKITGDEATLTAPGGIDVNTDINTLTATTTNSDITVVEDNGLTLNNINAGTGDVDITLLAGTLISNAGTTITGNDLVITGDGAININTDVNTLEASTNNADITVAEANGLGLNLVNAGSGDVSLTLAAGAITDNNGDQKNIIGDDVVLAAVDGIGSGDALETTMNTLTATNTNNGIEIIDEGGLSIVAPGVANTNGWVNITTLSPLNVNANVTAGGNINLTAGDNDAAANDDISIAANINITSTGGDVTLQAGDDIVQATGTGVISAGGGDIYLYAGHDNDGTGLINMAGVVGSGAETLAMVANEGISVTDAEISTLNAFNTDTGDIGITANTITSRTLTIDDVALGTGFGVKTNNGNVAILNNGTIDIPGTNIPTWPAGAGIYGNNITLTASGSGSDILLASTGTGTIITGIYAGATATLTADDNITAGSIGGANNGNTADIVAGSTIIMTATNGSITIGGDNNAAYSAVISGTGAVVMTAGQDININSNYGAAGTVLQAANTGATLPNYAVILNAGGNINFNALNTSIDAGTSPVLLVAGTGGGNVNDNNTNLDIVGGDLVIEAIAGIGSGNPIETKVSRLAARVTTGNGNIEILNTGDLILDDLIGWGYAVNNAGTGDINITVNSNLTVDDQIISNGGDITLVANSGGISQNANGDITTNTGNYTGTAVGPYWMADGAIVNTGSGDIDIDAGGDITIGQLIGLNVFLNSGGAILDGGDTAGEDIQALGAELIAGTGIGNGDAIDTLLTNLAATSTTGPININETDNLTVAPVGITTGITTTGDINLNIGGNLVLAANNDVNSNGGGITIYAVDVTQNDQADILSTGTSTDGNIALHIRDLTQMSDSKIDAGDANVDISSVGNINLDEINGNTVKIVTTSGHIEESAPDTPNDITDIKATDLIISATTGIGSNNTLETQVSRLNAYNNTLGDINIYNTGDLTIDDFAGVSPNGYGVDNRGGAVYIEVASSIDIPGTSGDGVYANNDVELTANDDIIAGSSGNGITAIESNVGGVTLTAGRDVYFGQMNYADIFASGHIGITAGNDITIDNFTWVNSALGNITFNATNNINILTRISGPDLTEISADIGTVSFTAGNDINITGFSPFSTYVSGGAGITLTANGNINTTNGTLETTGGSLTANAGGDINFVDSTSRSFTGTHITGQNVNLITTDQTTMIPTPIVEGYGDIEITATNGNIVVSAANPGDLEIYTVGANTHITLTSNNGNISVSNSSIYGSNLTSNSADITLTANGGDVTIDNSEIYTWTNNTPSGDIAITANTGGSLTINNSTIYSEDLNTLSNGGDITLIGNNNVAINDTEITTVGPGTIDITANTGNVNIDPSTITAEMGNIIITASAGDVNILDNSTVQTTGTGSIIITGNQNVGIADSTIDSGDEINIYAQNGDTEINSSTLTSDSLMSIRGNQNVSVSNSGLTSGAEMGIRADNVNAVISDSTLNSADEIGITANQNVDITNGTLTATAGIGITAINGYVTIDPSSLTAGTDITILAATVVSVVQSTLNATNNISITATANDINICTSTLTAGNNTTMTAGRDIIICADSSSTSGNNATLTAGGDIELGYIQAGNTATLTAGGEIRDNNEDNVNINAPVLVMSAVNGIGNADGIETQTANLTATNTTNGDIWIRNNTTTAGDLTINGITNSAPGGMVRVENGLIRFENGAVSEIDRTTGGNMTLAGVVQADGSVKLYTIGSILDGNTGTPYDVIATDTSDMLAFAGDGVVNPNNNPTIGVFDGVPDGSGYDPIEVNINPGDLYVFAEGENFFVSVGIDGIVQPRDVLLCYPHLVPPGLIFFNGRMNGGMRSNQWFRGVSTSIQYIGAEDTVYSEFLLQLIQDKYFQPEDAEWEMDEELEKSLDLVMN